jgi:hypothetical protein
MHIADELTVSATSVQDPDVASFDPVRENGIDAIQYVCMR